VKTVELARFTFRACLESETPVTLLDLSKFLTLAPFRDFVLKSTSIETQRYFATRFSDEDLRYVSALLNKLEPVLSSESVQQFFGHPSTLDLSGVLDQTGMLLINLAKGHLGPVAELVGRLIVDHLHFVALRRGSRPMDQRHPAALLLDEAHALAGSETGLDDLLVAGRKFKTYLTISGQSLSLFSSRLQLHLLGNCDRQWFFRLPFREGKTLAQDVFEPLGAWPRVPLRPYDRITDPCLTAEEEREASIRDLSRLPVGTCYWLLKGRAFGGRKIHLARPGPIAMALTEIHRLIDQRATPRATIASPWTDLPF